MTVYDQHSKEQTLNNAIRFLEHVGRTGPSPADYAATLSCFDLEKKQHQALLDRDPRALNELLGGRPKVLFAILAPEEEASQE
jgi:hypothetical protein